LPIVIRSTLISPRKTQLLIPESTHLSNKLSIESHDDTLAFGGLYKHSNKKIILSAKISKQTDSTSGTF
jgi:hypothetical protein